MNLYEIQSIRDLSLIDLEAKELRKVAKALTRYYEGQSSKRYVIKKGDRLHVCDNIEDFIYYKYREEPAYSFEYYDLSQ